MQLPTPTTDPAPRLVPRDAGPHLYWTRRPGRPRGGWFLNRRRACGLPLYPYVPGPSRERRFVEGYLARIGRFPPPDLLCERHLIDAYRSSGDPAILHRLILPNLRFSTIHALALCDGQVSALELIQEANLALIEGLRGYDPEGTVPLFGYVTLHIRERIGQFLARAIGDPLLEGGPELSRYLHGLEVGRAVLPGAVPELGLPALWLQHGICPALWQRCEDLVRVPELPLSALDEEAAERACATAGRPASDPETLLSEHEFRTHARKTLERVLPFLPPIEAASLQAYYLSDPPLTMKEIGSMRGITRGGAGQTIGRALSRLHQILPFMPPWRDAERGRTFEPLRIDRFRQLLLTHCRRKLMESKMDVKTCDEVLDALSVLIGQRVGPDDRRHRTARWRLCKELALYDPETYQAGVRQGVKEGLQQGIKQGFRQATEQGFQQGLQQGLAQGLQQGLAQGHDQALKEGLEQGIKQGIELGREIERRMLPEGEGRKEDRTRALTESDRHELRTLQALAIKLLAERFGWNQALNRQIFKQDRRDLLGQLIVALGSAPSLKEALRKAADAGLVLQIPQQV